MAKWSQGMAALRAAIRASAHTSALQLIAGAGSRRHGLPPHSVAIVTPRRSFGEALRDDISKDPAVRCRAYGDARALCVDADAQHGALVLCPDTWLDLAAWLDEIGPRLRDWRWILLCRLLVGGMFLSRLEGRECEIAPPGVSVDALRDALGDVVASELQPPHPAIAQRWRRFCARHEEFGAYRPPSRRELECGCAVSLGLSERTAASALCIGVTTVKSHVRCLAHRLGLRGARNLAALFQEALRDDESYLLV